MHAADRQQQSLKQDVPVADMRALVRQNLRQLLPVVPVKVRREQNDLRAFYQVKKSVKQRRN